MSRAACVGLAWCLAAGAARGQNLVPNPDFAGSLQGWVVAPGSDPVTLDVSQGSPAAPSARGQASPGGGAVLLSGCLPIDASQRYRLRARCLYAPEPGATGSCGVQADAWAETTCQGAYAAAWDESGLTAGWTQLSAVFANRQSRSLRVRLFVGVDGGGGAVANFDHVELDRLTKGDFNRDDQTDLLLRNGSSLMVWRMNGTQLVSEAAVSPSLPSYPGWSVATTDDFNQDGATDLVVRNALLGQTAIWYMDGAQRTSVFDLTYALDPPWQIVASADFDHNGFPDLVWRDTSTQKLLIWKLQGTQPIGDIVPSPDQAVNSNWTLVAALDFNLDGNADFLWYNTTSGKIVFWFMDQNVVRITGQFANPDSAGNSNWKVVAAGEYGDAGAPPNGPDIVWRNATSGKLVVWLMDAAGNRKSGVFTSPDAPTPALAWNVVGPR
jgi:hypothetical protein